MNPKGRPRKIRHVQAIPKISQFSPRGRPGRPDEIILGIDEFETLKLADYQNLDQATGAKIMKISRPSFGRILREARRKLVDALVNGKIIRFFGGPISISGDLTS